MKDKIYLKPYNNEGNIKAIKRILKNNPTEKIPTIAAFISTSISCPTYIAYYLLGNVIGFNDEIYKCIKEQEEFYQKKVIL